MRILLYLVFAVACFLNESRAQEVAVPIWGLYLDPGDAEARNMAGKLSGVGYAVHTDESGERVYSLLLPGDIVPLTGALKRKWRDGVRISYEDRRPDHCDTLVTRDTVIRYRSIRNNLINQYAQQLPGELPERFTRDPEAMEKYIREQERNFRRFLKGKNAPRYHEDMLWIMHGVREPESHEQLVYHFYQKGQELVTLRFDTLKGTYADRLEALRTDSCEAYPRSILVRKHHSEKLAPYERNYRPRGRKHVTKRYTLEFEQNEVSYSEDMLSEAIYFMRDNDYSIFSARVEGYASVEGTPEINRRLQERRAKVMLDILDKYNDEKIRLDTVITRERWDMFYHQIRGTSFAWMDTLSQAEIRERLQDKNIAEALEPLLAEQRKAVITLQMYQRLTEEEKVETALTDLTNTEAYIRSGRRPPANVNLAHRYMSVLDYLEDLVLEGRLEEDLLRSKVGSDGLITDLLYRKYAIDMEHFGENSPVFSFDEIIRRAHHFFLQAYEAYLRKPGVVIESVKTGEYLYDRLMSMQFLTEKAIKQEWASPGIWTVLDYPREPEFTGFELNKMSLNTSRISPGDLSASMNGSGFEVDFSRAMDTQYYYILKEIVLENNRQVLRYVYRSDEIFIYDLFQFLVPNIAGWDPEENHFADQEVDRKSMRSLLKRLNRDIGNLCQTQVDQLSLDFYLKEMNYFLHHGLETKEDEEHLLESFHLIRNYYRYHAAGADPEILFKVSRQLALLNRMLLSRDGTEAAYQVLQAASNHLEFEGELKKWYLQLAYYHNPRFPVLAGNLPDGEFCQIFTGENGLQPYRDMLKRYCKVCSR